MEKTDKSAEEILSEQNAFHLVKALDLIDECYHFLKAHPPSKETMSYNKWESLVEETDYMREFNANSDYERHNNEAQQLSEYKEVIKELLPLAQNFASTLRWDEEYSGDEVGGKEAQEIVDRAKKLIEK